MSVAIFATIFNLHLLALLLNTVFLATTGHSLYSSPGKYAILLSSRLLYVPPELDDLDMLLLCNSGICTTGGRHYLKNGPHI